MKKRQKYLEPGVKIEIKMSEIVSLFLCLFLIAYVSLFLTFLIRFDSFTVSGSSMEGNYYSKDIVYADKVSELNYGDVVIVYEKSLLGKKDEDGKPMDPYILKRIIGLPNDKVEIIYDNIFDEFRVKINNIVQVEYYLTKPWTKNSGVNNNVVLGENEIYILGDNRDKSQDSRDRDVGIKTVDDIVGVVKLKIEAGENFFTHTIKKIDFMFNLEFWFA